MTTGDNVVVGTDVNATVTGSGGGTCTGEIVVGYNVGYICW